VGRGAAVVGWAIRFCDIDTCTIAPNGQLSKDLIEPAMNVTCQTYLILDVENGKAQR